MLQFQAYIGFRHRIELEFVENSIEIYEEIQGLQGVFKATVDYRHRIAYKHYFQNCKEKKHPLSLVSTYRKINLPKSRKVPSFI